MLSNLLKTLTGKSHVRFTYELTRQLCSLNENVAEKQRAAKLIKKEEEEEDNLDIEASLFNQSSIKYEPVTAAEVLKQNKKPKPYTKKEHKPFVAKTNKPLVQLPKKSRLERQSESIVINDSTLGLEFTKLSLNDPMTTTLLITARSKKRRDKNSQIILEGRRLILEALEADLKLNTIIFSKKEHLEELKDEVKAAIKTNPCKIYKIPHHDLKTWSTLSTPPGVLAVFERPSLEHALKTGDKLTTTLPLTVVCDNIREPNNLGSIIRTCAALPCFQVVVTKGCCDPWDSKALRGGCGGHFRIPIRDDVDWQEVPMAIPLKDADNCCIFIAENNLQKSENQTEIIDYSKIDEVGRHNVVVIGGESHGVSPEAYRFMSTVGSSRGKCLNIPLAEGIDSLNVASALTLILYEIRKSILKSN